jgi:hypothetical protein
MDHRPVPADVRREELTPARPEPPPHRAHRRGISGPKALALLMLLTSYESHGELREAGLSDARITALLQESAAELVAVAAPRPRAS